MLDDLDIKIKFDLDEISKGMKFLNMNLKSAQTNAKKVEFAFVQISNQLNAIAKMSDAGIKRVFVAGAEGVKKIDLEDLKNRTQAAADELQRMWNEQSAALQSTVAGVINLNDAVTQKAATEAMARFSDQFNNVAEKSRQARQEMIGLSDASQSARITVRDPKAAPSQERGLMVTGRGLSSLAAIAVTTSLITSKAMNNVGTALTKVGGAVRSVQGTFNSFRQARLAPPVDPRFNLIGRAIDGIGFSAGTLIETIRKTADAIISGFGDSFSSVGKAAGFVASAIERVANTVAKWDWNVRSATGSLRLLSIVFFPLAGVFQKFRTILTSATGRASLFEKIAKSVSFIIEKIIDVLMKGGPILQMFGGALGKVKEVFDGLGDSTSSIGGKMQLLSGWFNDLTLNTGVLSAHMSGLGYVMTGTFAGATGPAGQFGNAMFFSLLPARLLFREFEGGRRVINATMMVFSAITSPVRLVTNAISSSRIEWDLLTKAVANKSFATRTAAKTLFMFYAASKPVAAILAGTANAAVLAAKGLVKLATPLTALARKTGSAIKNLVMFGKTSVEAGSEAEKLASSVGMVGAAMIGTRNAAKATTKTLANVFIAKPAGLMKSLVSSKLAMQALAGAAMAWGASTAIATETATVRFGTLLQDMDQGKALIQEITSFSARTPFDNASLRESAGLLLAAQVPADEVTNRLQMLGDVAAGVSQPIGDITKIFQKVASTGKLGLGEINQFAERGVPLYTALQDTLGVSRGEMLKMVSDGKLGFKDLDVALGSLTSGAGMFAGGMAKQSETFAGLWSTLKDNVAIVLEGLMGPFVEMGKGMMAAIIPMVQRIGEAINSLRPVVSLWIESSKALIVGLYTLGVGIFDQLAAVVVGAFAFMGIEGKSSFSGIVEGLVVFFAMAKYTFENFGTFTAIAFLKAQLYLEDLRADVGHFFAGVGKYLTWFGSNWSKLFLDAVAVVLIAFKNIGANIASAMSAIWDYISGRSNSLQFNWTPLTEGFRKSVSELPEISARAMTEVEKSISGDLGILEKQFGDGMGEAVNKALNDLKTEVPEVELGSGTGKADGRVEEDEAGKSARQVENKAISTRDGESSSLLASLFKGLEKDEQKKQTRFLSVTAEKLTDMERNHRNGRPIVARAWGT